MMLRKCPECKEGNYSANSSAEFWICHTWGTKISIEFQQPAGVKEEGNE